MKKYIGVLVMLFLLSSCFNFNGNKINEEKIIQEKNNQIVFKIINDTKQVYEFHPDYLLYSIKEIDDFSQEGSENNVTLYIENSNLLTIEYNQGRLSFIYDTPYPTSDMTYDLTNKLGEENIKDYKLTRLTDKYQFTVTELYNNEITVVGQLYNTKTNKTYTLSILIRRIVRL